MVVRMSLEEYSVFMADFMGLDTNSNGYLDRSEVTPTGYTTGYTTG